MNLINKIKIKLTCNKIGNDEFGNSYYESKSPSLNGKKKRCIIYRGQVEASKIPCRWHRWIHYTCDEAPININTNKNSWQKTHLPNLSGTIYHHDPRNVENKLGNRKKVSADYESWSPNN